MGQDYVTKQVSHLLLLPFGSEICSEGPLPARLCDLPRNFSYDLPHKSRPLAKMTLHARDSWFWLAGGDLLFVAISLALGFMQILQVYCTVGDGMDSTYVTRIDTDGDAGLLLDFLRHLGGGCRVVWRWTTRRKSFNARDYSRCSPEKFACRSECAWQKSLGEIKSRDQIRLRSCHLKAQAILQKPFIRMRKF